MIYTLIHVHTHHIGFNDYIDEHQYDSINNATEGQPLSVCGRGTRQRGGGCCALVGVGFLPDGSRWAVRNYLFAAALCVVVEKQGQGGSMVGRTSSSG